MPRSNSNDWAVNDTITAKRLQDVNLDVDDLYATWSDQLRVVRAASWTPLMIDVLPWGYYIWSVIDQYNWWSDIAVANNETNYVMIDDAWDIVISTSSFTVGLWRLAEVVCSWGNITSIQLWKDVVVWALGMDIDSLSLDNNIADDDRLPFFKEGEGNRKRQARSDETVAWLVAWADQSDAEETIEDRKYTAPSRLNDAIIVIPNESPMIFNQWWFVNAGGGWDGLIKMKTINIVRSGTYTVRFNLKASSGGSSNVQWQIFVNGSSVGTLRSTNQSSYQVYDQNISLVAGDELQLYLLQKSSGARSHNDHFSIRWALMFKWILDDTTGSTP